MATQTVAEERIGAAQVMFEELGDWGGLNWSWGILAWVRFMQGRIEEAERIAREQLVESEASGNRWVAGILGVLLANVALWSGRPAQSLERARDAVARFRAIGDSWGESQGLYVLVRALAAAGRIDDAFAELDVREEKQSLLTGVEGIASVVRAQLLVHIGGPEALASALHLGGGAGAQAFTINAELQMLLGLALLQAGRADEAVAELEAARARARRRCRPGAALRAALALALVACGDAPRRGAGRRRRGQGHLPRPAGVPTRGRVRRAPDGRSRRRRPVRRGGRRHGRHRVTARPGDRPPRAIARVDRARTRRRRQAIAQKAVGVLGHDLSGWDRMFRLAARTSAHSA